MKKHLIKILCFVLLCSCGLRAQFIDKKTVSLNLAKSMGLAAEEEAIRNKWNVVICIVDDGGNLVYLARMDGAQFGSVEAAIQKARSAIAFKRPTKAFEDMVANGRNAILNLPGAVPLEGGLPLMADGQFIGAVGVSGAKSSEDGLVAKAAADRLESR